MSPRPVAAVAVGELTPKICEPGGKGLFLPLTKVEEEWVKSMRSIVYLLCLLYMFMGVSVAADFFVMAIETITSRKKRVRSKQTGRYVTILVWNDTVANLTLLALGSSAPEILLSVIETVSNGFYSGDLGPSTIVGSAAFNLLVIVAVCIVSIQSPEVRAIKEMSVFHVTVVFAFFAYFWLLIIVAGSSKNVIELWEALVTLAMFPLLVAVSFAADKGYMNFMSLERPENAAASLAVPVAETCEQDGSGGFHKAPAHPRLAKCLEDHPRLSNSGRRTSMLLDMGAQARSPQPEAGSRRSVRGSLPGPLEPEAGNLPADIHMEVARPAGDDGRGICCVDGKLISNAHGVITFREDAMTVHGVAGERLVYVDVLRRNGALGPVSCRYRTEKLTAVPGYDYEEVEQGVLEFGHGESLRQVELRILPKRDWERADSFQLILEDMQGGAAFNPNDDGGKEHGVLTVTIANGIKQKPEGLMDRLAILGEFLLDRDNFRLGLQDWRQQVGDAFLVGGGGDEEEDEGEGDGQEGSRRAKHAAPMDYIVHVVGLPWKLLFALASPPATWGGGWCLFCAALGYIGLVTAVICDLASLFGCCTGLADSVTAVTVVALGTSLPDMFASQSSARNDPTADASIVNVTGSNSVNVFLGIGIPWTFAALYWMHVGATDKWKSKYGELEGIIKDYPDGAFVVVAGDLAFSVTIFNAVAVIALSVLRVRRLAFGGELGGPKREKLGSAALFVVLWLVYIGASIWRSASEDAEMLQMPMVGLAVGAILIVVAFEAVMRSSGRAPQAPPVPELRGSIRLSQTSPQPEQLPRGLEGQRPSKLRPADAGWSLAEEDGLDLETAHGPKEALRASRRSTPAAELAADAEAAARPSFQKREEEPSTIGRASDESQEPAGKETGKPPRRRRSSSRNPAERPRRSRQSEHEGAGEEQEASAEKRRARAPSTGDGAEGGSVHGEDSAHRRAKKDKKEKKEKKLKKEKREAREEDGE